MPGLGPGIHDVERSIDAQTGADGRAKPAMATFLHRATAPDQAALNFSAYWVRSSAYHDGSGGRLHSLERASPG